MSIREINTLPKQISPEEAREKLFKMEISEGLVLRAPTKKAQELENMYRLAEKFFASKPQLKNVESMTSNERLSEQRRLNTEHLNRSFTNYTITKRHGEDDRDSLRRQINYITHPYSSSDKPEEKSYGMTLRSQALQAVTQGLSENDLNSLIDDFISIKNNEGLSEILRYLKTKKPTDARQGKTISEARTKITSYFRETSNLEALENELLFTNKYIELANSRLEDIESRLKMVFVG